MPPHLHPRSRFTSSLFATTLFASFFVVALPHALPCPAPRMVRADGEMPDGTPRKRRRRMCVEKQGEVDQSLSGASQIEESSDGVSLSPSSPSMPKRECPVPKPGGIVGEIFGFRPSKNDNTNPKPP
ncbi:hypothetical protein B0O99DRAFT_605518 [Bisporella sp. PMI_857]|nr:hypothetical protein B0O99DRAFT_605518 [Bisporella sp. PMI_857]